MGGGRYLDGLKPFLDYVQNHYFKASLSREVLKYHVDQSFELYYTNYILGRLKPFSLLPFSFPLISQVADELEEPCGLGEQGWGAGRHGQGTEDLCCDQDVHAYNSRLPCIEFTLLAQMFKYCH